MNKPLGLAGEEVHIQLAASVDPLALRAALAVYFTKKAGALGDSTRKVTPTTLPVRLGEVGNSAIVTGAVVGSETSDILGTTGATVDTVVHLRIMVEHCPPVAGQEDDTPEWVVVGMEIVGDPFVEP